MFKRAFFSLYNLVSAVGPLNSRTRSHTSRGALLKVEFPLIGVGYASLHPWESLGDPSLASLLNQLQLCEFSHPLLKQALVHASLDARARTENRSLLDGLQIPPSHYFFSTIELATEKKIHSAYQQGFRCFKIKGGRDIRTETCLLKALDATFKELSVSVRLDFNESLSDEKWSDFLDALGTLPSYFEFLEDPIPFHEAKWANISAQGIPLACDRQVLKAIHHPHTCRYLIAKPALLGSPLPHTPNQHWVFTSYLDHPLGQVAAAYMAAMSYQTNKRVALPAGLLSHHVYQPTAYSKLLKQDEKGPYLQAPQGLGWGFDQLLEQEPWTPL